HAALPFAAIPAFMAKLGELNGSAARALEFTILCAARTGEVLGAEKEEFDFKNRLWTIPRERMKAGREHRVPLSRQALAVAEAAAGDAEASFLFPGMKSEKPLSNMAMSK